MIKCKFQYMHSSGAASSSLITEINVNALPRIGELLFINNDAMSKVVNILHEIDTANGEHTTTVQYKQVD